MNRVAVFVDAGYVFAQGSVLLAGWTLPRSETSLEHAGTGREALVVVAMVTFVVPLPC